MHAERLPQVVEALRIGVGIFWTAAWAIILGLVFTKRCAVVTTERFTGSASDYVNRLRAAGDQYPFAGRIRHGGDRLTCERSVR